MDWTVITRLGARQHGVVARWQLVVGGWTDREIKTAIATGKLVVLHTGVYRVGGAPPSPESVLMAAVLAAGEGAAASHASAAWLWGLAPDPPDRPEVVLNWARNPRIRGVDVHRSRDFEPRWIRTRRGIPATDPLHTMLVLGASLPRREVSDALERGVMAGLFSVRALEWVRAELAERGRNGCGVLREILDDRALGADRPDGMLEPRMAQLCARYGVERPVFQHRVYDDCGRFVAKVDFGYPEVKAFLEVDGFEVHGTPAAMEADFVRQNRLVALGWTPIRFGWRRLVQQPARVAAEITAILQTLRDL